MMRKRIHIWVLMKKQWRPKFRVDEVTRVSGCCDKNNSKKSQNSTINHTPISPFCHSHIHKMPLKMLGYPLDTDNS